MRNAFNRRNACHKEEEKREAVTLTRTTYNLFYRKRWGKCDTLQFKIVSIEREMKFVCFFFSSVVFVGVSIHHFLGATFCLPFGEIIVCPPYTLDLNIIFFFCYSIQKHYKIVISISKLFDTNPLSLFTNFGLCEK